MAGLNLQYLPIFNGSSISSSTNKSNNMSAIGAAAITAGASLLGGLMSSASSKAAQKREFKYNTQLQQQASQLQQANWEKQFNLQNDYNTPEAQRARLEAAGMNPNLAYGNQWVNGMSPAASAPTSSVGHAGEGAAAWSSAMNNMAQILSMLNVNESVANRNNAEANLFDTQAEDNRNRIDNTDYEVLYSDIPYNELLEIQSRTNKNSNDVWINKWRYNLDKQVSDWNHQMDLDKLEENKRQFNKSFGLEENKYNLQKVFQEQSIAIAWKEAMASIGLKAAEQQQALATAFAMNELGFVHRATKEGLELNNNWERFLRENRIEIPYGEQGIYRSVSYKELAEMIKLAQGEADIQATKTGTEATRIEAQGGLLGRIWNTIKDTALAIGATYFGVKKLGNMNKVANTQRYNATTNRMRLNSKSTQIKYNSRGKKVSKKVSYNNNK